MIILLLLLLYYYYHIIELIGYKTIKKIINIKIKKVEKNQNFL